MRKISKQKRFTTLCNKLACRNSTIPSPEHIRQFHQDMNSHYREPHRKYHTLRHIGFMLHEFDAVKKCVRDPEILEMAIWLHDVIYDPRSKTNEEDSARYAIEMLGKIGCTQKVARMVAQLIRATTHMKIPRDPDAKLLVDLDLLPMSISAKRFAKESKWVREEFEWVPIDRFCEGRTTFLQSLLDRRHIYTTNHFRKAHEASARENLHAAIERAKRHLL